MIDVKETFIHCYQEDGWFYPPSYDEIVSSFGSIEVKASTKDHSGDSFYLIKKDNYYGYLAISWGSCSGCDALLACDNYGELQQLVDKLEVTINWQSSFEDMQKFIDNRNWELTIDYHTGAKEFIKKFKEYTLRVFK